MRAPAASTPPDSASFAVPPLPWDTAQDNPTMRTGDKYLPESDAHPPKVLPAVAAHAIAAYTESGDLVVDPMAGIGTTLVEAMRLDRMAIGVEYEPRWAALAMQNVEHAVNRGAPGFATVVNGDAREIEALVGRDVRRRASLVLASLPWNLGDSCCDSSAFVQVLSSRRTLLKPDGFLVIVANAGRGLGQAGDVAAVAVDAVLDAGFALHERCHLLLAPPDDEPMGCAADTPLVVARAGGPDDHSMENTGCGCGPDLRYNASSRRSA